MVVGPASITSPSEGVVHVIQTRFMQFQPNLTELGWARLGLFEAFTFPSVTHQTNQQFAWIIRTDPQLNIDLRTKLICLLSGANATNIFLVASNENPEGFRCKTCIVDTEGDRLWYGNQTILESYWRAAQSSIVLETRLDADDALLLDYCDTLQQDAVRRLSPSRQGSTSSFVETHASTLAVFVVYCAEQHLEWQYGTIWDSEEQQTVVAGKRGSLIGLTVPHCVTPGLTWAYAKGAPLHIETTHHHAWIHKAIPRCKADKKLTTEPCLVRVKPFGNLPTALRARTPTSAGMDRVILGKSEHDEWQRQLRQSKWKTSQDVLFRQLPSLYGVHEESLRNIRHLIEKNLLAIVADALNGQCTKGHSCKEGAKKALKSIMTSE